MKLIDTHCHIDREGYDNVEEVLKETKEELELAINIGCCVQSSLDSKILAESNDFIYFSAGVHPNYSSDFSEKDVDALRDMLKSNKAVAVGEIGLDYYRDIVPADKQKVAFRRQLVLAKETKKPVVIHGREAYEDIVNILNEDEFKDITVIMHSYAGSYSQIESLLDRAFISFSGILTFPKAIAKETALKVPMSKILVETDAPFLAPQPVRGRKNFPATRTKN